MVRLALALLAGLAATARAADTATAAHALHTLYGESFYVAEVDRLLRDADGKAVFGGPGAMPAARARNRSLTRQAMLVQRSTVLKEAADRVASLASDRDLGLVLHAAEQPGAPVDEAALAPGLAAIRRGFDEAAGERVARYASGNANMLCKQGESSYCP